MYASDVHPSLPSDNFSFSAVQFAHPAGLPWFTSSEFLLSETTLKCECDLVKLSDAVLVVVFFLAVSLAESTSFLAAKTHESACGKFKIEKETYAFQHPLLAFGLNALPHTHKLPVDVLQASDKRVPNGLLYLFLDETSGERPQGLVQEMVVRVADGELEGVNFDLHVGNFEYGGGVFARQDELDSGLRHHALVSELNRKRKRERSNVQSSPRHQAQPPQSPNPAS